MVAKSHYLFSLPDVDPVTSGFGHEAPAGHWSSRFGIYENRRLYCATQKTAKIVAHLGREPCCAFEVATDLPPYRGVRGQGKACITQSRGPEMMMAVAAWLVWREGRWKEQGRVLGLFLLQWLLNAPWTPLFFGMHRPGLAFVEIILLWLALAATLVSFWRVRRPAGVLLVPYLAWVSLAAVLNFAI